MDLLDFSDCELYFDVPMPAAAEQLLAQASAEYGDPSAETALLRAHLLAPENLTVLVGLYRYYFYQHRPGDALQVADLELDLLRRRVTRAGRRIDLTAKEFALLELLLRRQGEVLPRSLIASQVWDMNFDSDTNVVEVAVRRLRAKIDDDFEPKLIRTVRGMGYVLEAPAS